jgi:hypothetical protein
MVGTFCQQTQYFSITYSFSSSSSVPITCILVFFLFCFYFAQNSRQLSIIIFTFFLRGKCWRTIAISQAAWRHCQVWYQGTLRKRRGFGLRHENICICILCLFAYVLFNTGLLCRFLSINRNRETMRYLRMSCAFYRLWNKLFLN